MQVHLKALGCRLNEAEIEHWASDFQSLGHTITRQPEQADLVVINTCAVTSEAARKSRQLIRRSHRFNPGSKLVISGCYNSLEPDNAARLDGVDLLVPNGQKDRLVDIVNREIGLHTMPARTTQPGETALFQQGRNRAFIKIQDGCRYRCSFCIVTLARGGERSRHVADIVNEINTLHSRGVQEAVLTGVHVGGYGSDTGSSLYDLLHIVLTETDIPRIRLGSVEPWDLPKNFFRLFDNPRLMPHLHLPLQSGSDSVLRRMSRRCKTGDFARLVETARQSIADFQVTTDIIVGFPGETDSEWRESLDFLQATGFSHLHIFSYSRRHGTKAARMPDQVDPDVKKRRSRELHRLGQKMKLAILEEYVGSTQPVLWENRDVPRGQTGYSGYTPNFLRARLKQSKVAAANTILPVKLASLDREHGLLNAELI